MGRGIRDRKMEWECRMRNHQDKSRVRKWRRKSSEKFYWKVERESGATKWIEKVEWETRREIIVGKWRDK